MILRTLNAFVSSSRLSIRSKRLLSALCCATAMFPSACSNAENPNQEDLKKKLTPLQYKVTQEEGTEPPFQNEYWNNKHDGIYVDLVSGAALFSSADKYDSGTGWPSFTKPLQSDAVKEKQDNTLFTTRTEVRSASSDSHLGHVFDDGPAPTGKRYCMNSAALKFVPIEKLKEEGYGQYLGLFRAAKGPSYSDEQAVGAPTPDESSSASSPPK